MGANYARFLVHLASGETVDRAAGLAGFERSAVYKRAKKDPAFAVAMSRARYGEPICCSRCGEVVT